MVINLNWAASDDELRSNEQDKLLHEYVHFKVIQCYPISISMIELNGSQQLKIPVYYL